MTIDKEILRLEREGKLRKQRVGHSQIEALLKEAVRDIEEARKILDLAERAAYIMAYMAMLKTGRALLLEMGYVPDDGAQHKTVVDLTGLILGGDYKAITARFESMRRKRNEMTYEAGALISARDAEKAFDDAVGLMKGVLLEVRRHNPQFKFKFEE